MKKNFLVFTAAAIFSVSFINAIAQNSIANIKSEDVKNLTAYVSVDNPMRAAKIDKSALYKINFKAVQDFKNTYTDISDENWETLKDGYIARFSSNSVHTMNYYDKKGRWLYCIQRYDETKLPKNVRGTVKSTYYDYSITSVQEINMTKNNENPIYIVYVADNNDHKTLRVCNGEMEEVNL